MIKLVAEDVVAAGVILNKSTTSLVVGAEETLVATVAPSDAANKAVTWLHLLRQKQQLMPMVR